MSTWMMRRTMAVAGIDPTHESMSFRVASASLPVACARRRCWPPQQRAGQTAQAPPATPLAVAQETHLENMKQLTYGGENAEAYFSFDGTAAEFPEHPRQPRLRPDLHDEDRRHPICTWSAPARAGRPAASTIRTASHLLYASTHLGGAPCPPRAEHGARLRLGGLRHVRHLPREPDGIESRAADEHAGLRRRGHHRQGRPHRVHERARRRHGDLLDERRRHRTCGG